MAEQKNPAPPPAPKDASVMLTASGAGPAARQAADDIANGDVVPGQAMPPAPKSSKK